MKLPAIEKIGYYKRLSQKLGWVLIFFPFNHAVAQTDTTTQLKELPVRSLYQQILQSATPAQQIKTADFVKYSAFNVADAIRGFSGVNVRDYGGVGGLKTVSVRGLGGNHTSVLFNGVQINDAQNGQIDLSKLNLYNLESITLFVAQPDILLQPARSFASASSLSIITKTPKLTKEKPFQATVGTKTGSFGLFNPYIQWQQRLSNKWTFTADANFIHVTGKYKYKIEGDRSDTLATRRNGGIRSLQTNAGIYWVKSDSNKLSININYFDSKRGLPGAVIFYNPYNGQFIDNNDLFGQITYKRIWRSGLQLLSGTKLSQLKTHYLDPNFLNQQGFLDQRYNQREFYQSVALAYTITPFFQVSYSADVSLTKMDADLFNYAYPTRRTILNVLAANYTSGKLRLQANLLQTSLTERVKAGVPPASRSALAPTIIATVSLTDRLKLRAFYKEVFRAPTLDEVYFYAINNPRNIEPESAKQYNLGFAWTRELNGLFKSIEFSADGYYNSISNRILAVPGRNPAIFSFSNVGKVSIKGIDARVRMQTDTGMPINGSFSANYSYQQTIDVTDPARPTYGQQLPYTPKHTLSANTGLNYHKAGLYLNYLFASPRYYEANNVQQYYMPAYSILDISGAYRLKINKAPVQASVEINNLLNSTYSVIRNYPMPGRSYRITLQITI